MTPGRDPKAGNGETRRLCFPVRFQASAGVCQDDLPTEGDCYDRARTLYDQIGARLCLANILLALGDLSVRLAELTAAGVYYDRALPL